jgi:hypothetical protein
VSTLLSELRAVEVSVRGWQVVDAVPVKFTRSRGTEAMPEPGSRRDGRDTERILNVESDGDFRLICAWLIAALRSTGPLPVLVIAGQQGTSKSTLARVCRLLIEVGLARISRGSAQSVECLKD